METDDPSNTPTQPHDPPVPGAHDAALFASATGTFRDTPHAPPCTRGAPFPAHHAAGKKP